ncbi:MAG: glutathione peroxidase [Chthoniobacter sp.]|nr:glutathione peroxidase [Chthoniobacter sp.]
MKTARLLLTAACTLLMTASLFADDAKLYTIPLKDIDGKDTSLKTYAGKPLLIVNVASQCGFTKQYTGLEAVWRKYKDQGLVVLGFPCNDFGAQEPGTTAEIKQFCSTKFDVTFPLFDKLHVKGEEQHPLYATLTGADSPAPGPVKWNFGKFLIGRDGKIIARFDSKITPDSPELTQAIEAALAAK